MLTNVLKPDQAQPRDLSNRLLQRMYPGDFGTPPAPKSPTGLPISTPPPPRPVMAQASGVQPQAAMGASPLPVAPGSALPGIPGSHVPAYQPQGAGFGAAPAGSGTPPPSYASLSPEHQKMVSDYFHSLAGIDYKGSHESALLQQSALEQLLRGWEAEAPIDYTSASPLADAFGHSRNAMEAELAARGLNGGVVGGALSNSYASEARGIGDYIRQLVQQRQAEHHSDYQRFLDWTRQLNAMGLGQNIQEQNDPGIWGDITGILGGVGGKVLGGLIP